MPRPSLFLPLLPALCLACQLEPPLEDEGPGTGKSDDIEDAVDGALDSELIPSLDDEDSVDILSWNLQWFGDEESGPSDEALQFHNAQRVIRGLALDIVGLVEIVSADAFAELDDALDGYHGVVASDVSVESGPEFYWFGEQKPALLVRDRFEITSARLILTESANDFGGRPPLEVKLRFEEEGKARTLVVIVTHFKALANRDGYERRVAAAQALQAFLDEEYPWQWVAVIGDFNDDIDRSTFAGQESPLAGFVESAAYRFTTDTLSADNISTTTNFSSTIDHHLVTDDLAERFVEGSAEVLRIDELVDDYEKSTTDHYPVLTRYDLR